MRRIVLFSALLSSLFSAFATATVMMLFNAPRAEAQNTVVRAQSFEVVDGTGRTRAALGIDNGTIGLFLIDGNGTTRISATLLPDGSPSFILSDAAHQGRAYLTLGRGGFATLNLADAQGHLRAVLSDASGVPSGLAFYDSDSNLLWSAP